MTNEQPTQPPESTAISPASNELDFAKLTHQNWLFINAFLATGNVQKAYQTAKYEGTEKSAPYQVFKRMKTYIEAIGDLDVTSRARLQADVKELLDIPLLESQKIGVTIKEKLQILKLAASITPDATKAKTNISVLVINRPSKGNGTGEKVSASNEIPPENIIDVQPLP